MKRERERERRREKRWGERRRKEERGGERRREEERGSGVPLSVSVNLMKQKHICVHTGTEQTVT